MIFNFLFLFLLLFCAICVVFSKNPIHSILFLVLTFFSASGLLLLQNLEFLGMIFLIVYVGAIAVLFLFVVMMLNIRVIELKENFVKYFPILGIISLAFFFQIFFFFFDLIKFEIFCLDFSNLDKNSITFSWVESYFYLPNVKVISHLLYVNFISIFWLGGLLLLVSMLGAISLTLNNTSNVKRQFIYKQISRDFLKTVATL